MNIFQSLAVSCWGKLQTNLDSRDFFFFLSFNGMGTATLKL